MAYRKTKTSKICYVVPFPYSQPGHRLGVNALVLDTEFSSFDPSDAGILYTAGRDGQICAWDLHLNIEDDNSSGFNVKNIGQTTFRSQTQAHTHWVNDICLAHGGQSVVSCSSDLSVKLWRAHSEHSTVSQTIGQHADYVKCLGMPSSNAEWVCSGGLDRKIILWDIVEGRNSERLKIEFGDQPDDPKASVYALAVGGHEGSVIAAGGPESIVKLWDSRTGDAIGRLIGHTDNIRSLLLSEDGECCLSASSDSTIKMWDLRNKRCLHTFTMHSDSVWTLNSQHPSLQLFHSGDRSGYVMRTDIRGIANVDDAECVAVCKEHEGVADIATVGNKLWTATSSSNIDRWTDATEWDPTESRPLSYHRHRASSSASKLGKVISKTAEATTKEKTQETEKELKVPFKSRLRLTSVDIYSGKLDEVDTLVPNGNTKDSVITDIATPLRDLAEETVHGLHGIVRYVSLNDRRRVLTLDTAGSVALWDILQCKQLKNYGNVELDVLRVELNSTAIVANWCHIDTRTGALTVIMDEGNSFDAEIYADETEEADLSKIREDQRFNIGKWVLKNLFEGFVKAELAEDEIRRVAEFEEAKKRKKERDLKKEVEEAAAIANGTANGTLGGIQPLQIPYRRDSTPFVENGTSLANASSSMYTSGSDDGNTATTPWSAIIPSGAKDYFSLTTTKTNTTAFGSPLTDKSDTGATSSFVTRFRSLGSRKMSKNNAEKEANEANQNQAGPEAGSPTAKNNEDESPPPVEETEVQQQTPFMISDVLKDISSKYAAKFDSLLDQEDFDPDNFTPESILNPVSMDDTPFLAIPEYTTIFVSEEHAEAGANHDVYRGKVSTVGQDRQHIEEVAPGWLGELLLMSKLPLKEPIKISFVLKPMEPLKELNNDNARLNANRMLRVRKIKGYITERLDQNSLDLLGDGTDNLELLCLNTVCFIFIFYLVLKLV